MFFSNNGNAKYDKTFFDFNIKSIEGNEIYLKDFKNSVILLVNTASYCGFTKQYDGLQEIYQKYKDKGLIVIGVPSNSFNQEKNDESEIKEFCDVNFSITFPMTSIYDVGAKMLILFINGLKIIMGNLLSLNGIFIKLL